MARAWLVRLGKFGEQEPPALASGDLAVGWELPSLAQSHSKDAIAAAVEDAYPDQKSGTLQNWAVQLNQFANAMVAGDLTVTPLKSTGQIAIGRVEGTLSVDADGHPVRHVKWLRTDLPRDTIKQDLLYSLGASQTVCEISRNSAAERFEALVATGKDPGPATGAAPGKVEATDTTTAEGNPNFAVNARDQIERFIAANFVGHGFTELIAAILRAQGYQTRVPPPGADKGVDILAGQGALGFVGPRLVVQVKSGGVVADQPTLQALLGTIQDTHADHGLLVSWSGFTGAVRQRTNDLYFRVRLWGRDEIMDALFEAYERLPESVRAELPLRRIWSLVADD